SSQKRGSLLSKAIGNLTKLKDRFRLTRRLTGIVAVLFVASIVWTLGARRPSGVDPKLEVEASVESVFGPTITNRVPAPQHAQEGMVWIPGGEFSMGASDPPDLGEVGMKATQDARPIHRVYVDGFWMDRTDVTNEQFERFVRATGYVTVAERKPRAEEFPGAPPANLVAGSVVFSPPDHPVALDDHFQWWSYVPGASWRHPL